MSQNSNSFSFSYTAPVISSISPVTGPMAGGTVVTVTGSSFGFANATVMRFGGLLLRMSYTPSVLGQLTQVPEASRPAR